MNSLVCSCPSRARRPYFLCKSFTGQLPGKNPAKKKQPGENQPPAFVRARECSGYTKQPGENQPLAFVRAQECSCVPNFVSRERILLQQPPTAAFYAEMPSCVRNLESQRLRRSRFALRRSRFALRRSRSAIQRISWSPRKSWFPTKFLVPGKFLAWTSFPNTQIIFQYVEFVGQ